MDKKARGDSKDHFTSEYLAKKFINPFDLVNHAIKIAENMMLSGRPPRVRTEVIGLNPTSIVLEEIYEGKDYLDEILDDEEEENQNHSSHSMRPVNGKNIQDKASF